MYRAEVLDGSEEGYEKDEPEAQSHNVDGEALDAVEDLEYQGLKIMTQGSIVVDAEKIGSYSMEFSVFSAQKNFYFSSAVPFH
jgi:hypothetical protein